MSRKTLIGTLVPVAILTLACLCVPTGLIDLTKPPTQAPVTETPVIDPVTTDVPIEIPPSCSVNLEQTLEDAENIDYEGEELDTDYVLVVYEVSGDTISDPQYGDSLPANLESYQDDTATQQELWQSVTDIIPADQRTLITHLVFYTDGISNSLGAVEQADDPHAWILEMDIADAVNFPTFSTTLVHEFAHLLTLNEAQVPIDYQVFNNPDDEEIYSRQANACPTYFTFEGCSNVDSYLYVFYDRFWAGIYDEWLGINTETDPDVLDQELMDFYNKYYDQFVSSYAATSPEEDIAESFMYFVFAPRPSGTTISDYKILFFYEYPELVILRGRILENLCNYVGN